MPSLKEPIRCFLTLNNVFLLLAPYCFAFCKCYCFLVFTLGSNIAYVYSLFCLMNHSLASGSEICNMYSETLEKCVFTVKITLQNCLAFCVQNCSVEFLLG